MANKQERIAALIRKNIAEIIQFDLKNPHLGFVSIPEVKVSNDFSYAKVYVSFINENEIKEGMEVLNHSKGFIRSELASKMDTRRMIKDFHSFFNFAFINERDINFRIGEIV